MKQNGKFDYGWEDIANWEEALDFYQEKYCRGHTHSEICRMLREYFPEVDTITLGKLRTNALRKLLETVNDIDKKVYIAESINRLKRIMANPNERTKNILAADAQLTSLLRLNDATQNLQEPDDIARKIQLSIHLMDASVGGCKDGPDCPICKEAENETEGKGKTETPNGKGNETSKDASITPEEEKELNKQLLIARFKRLKQDVTDAEKNNA